MVTGGLESRVGECRVQTASAVSSQSLFYLFSRFQDNWFTSTAEVFVSSVAWALGTLRCRWCRFLAFLQAALGSASPVSRPVLLNLWTIPASKNVLVTFSPILPIFLKFLCRSFSGTLRAFWIWCLCSVLPLCLESLDIFYMYVFLKQDTFPLLLPVPPVPC